MGISRNEISALETEGSLEVHRTESNNLLREALKETEPESTVQGNNWLPLGQ